MQEIGPFCLLITKETQKQKTTSNMNKTNKGRFRVRWGAKQDKKTNQRKAEVEDKQKIQHIKLNLKIACCQEDLAFTSGFSQFSQGSLHRYEFSLYFLGLLGARQDSHCIFQGFWAIFTAFSRFCSRFWSDCPLFPGFGGQYHFCISDSCMFSSISAFQAENGVQKGQDLWDKEPETL